MRNLERDLPREYVDRLFENYTRTHKGKARDADIAAVLCGIIGLLLGLMIGGVWL